MTAATVVATQPAKPRVLRRAVGSVPVDPAHYDSWYALASSTPGLSGREILVLARLCEHFRELAEKGEASALSYNKIGFDLDVDPDLINAAVRSLVQKGLVGLVKRGSGRSNAYAMTLPKRMAASLAPVVEDAPPF
jgi:hypothetical protein